MQTADDLSRPPALLRGLVIACAGLGQASIIACVNDVKMHAVCVPFAPPIMLAVEGAPAEHVGIEGPLGRSSNFAARTKAPD